MTVYDLIKKLVEYDSDTEITFKVGNLETNDIEINYKYLYRPTEIVVELK